MSARLTRAMLSDHQRRRMAEEEASDWNALALIALLIACTVLGAIFLGLQ